MLPAITVATARPPPSNSGSGSSFDAADVAKHSTRSRSPTRHHSRSRSRSRSRSNSASTLTNSTNSSSNSLHGHAPLPPNIAWIEELRFQVDASKNAKAEIRYTLLVEHVKTGASWRHVHAFDEFRLLQKRLLKQLRHGHFCQADCPWLYSFVKSFFPKTSIFFGRITRLMELRQKLLQECFMGLQKFLLDKSNHSCSVVTFAIVNEVLAFVNGEEGSEHQKRTQSASVLASPVYDDSCTEIRLSWASAAHGSDEDDASQVGDDDSLCGLCHEALYAEPHHDSDDSTNSLPSPPVSPANAQVGSAHPSRSRRTTHAYTTMLSCGHQFHDECIVPKLNEDMRCPTCGHDEH
ncbi:hypothetical protein Poli38472_011688 [Pythium oligandrum]|uniref:RING-type domain-containing protein n=1 Tax=Pythium oligandrum TaxID=41045 RepID=A0A8K1C895_PYTOL|nr:hypothetical protein Poli38472_011688 [Pythium oligandrum]|eukprot:TMW58100.1 hypothetical protein Poli38472_011688 [Pythium oligandrum]